MKEQYIISIDQSTQGTKALLFGRLGELIHRTDKSHEQIINEQGWVSHNPSEIYQNTLDVVKRLLEETKIEPNDIIGMGISNQRETSLAWDRETGEPIGEAIVWQCARAEKLCERIVVNGTNLATDSQRNNEWGGDEFSIEEMIQRRTGIPLSPYFPAAKIAWLLQYQEGAGEKARQGKTCHGTIDSWLVYKLTNRESYKTDYSNASRTQLFNIFELAWDEEICKLFGVRVENLPEVCDSDSCFGYTDFDGLLPQPIPIHGVLGDSHGALFGQGCTEKGMVKCTYGTGSSIMMNVGEQPVVSEHGIVTSLAWKIGGKVNYVLEGNLNYTGAVITWLKDDLQMISSPEESEALARAAKADDGLYLVPAFSGLGAPYWNAGATAAYLGMTRTTKKAEMVRSAVESIAYQIADILQAMSKDSKLGIEELRVDGGPTRNSYLMEFQSNIADVTIQVPDSEELSGIGVAYVCGIALDIYDIDIAKRRNVQTYKGDMSAAKRKKKYDGWKSAVYSVLRKEEHCEEG